MSRGPDVERLWTSLASLDPTPHPALPLPKLARRTRSPNTIEHDATMDDDVAYEPPSASSSSSDEWPEDDDSRYRTSTRRVLVHVLARKDRDAKQMQHLLRSALAKLAQESQRASTAERRAATYLARAQSAVDAQAVAESAAARTREELGMYKVQLEQAQREILRAQDLLTDADARLHEAEASAARARTVARKLAEERAVEAARDEGRKAGWREGVRRGWAMGWEEGTEEGKARPPRPPRTTEETEPSRAPPPPLAFVRPPSPPSPSSSPSRSPTSSSTSSMVEILPRPPASGNGTSNAPPSRTHGPTLTTPFRTPSPTPVPTPDLTRPARIHRHRTPEPRRQPQVDPAPVYVPPPPATGPLRPYTPHSDAPSSIHPIPIHNGPPTTLHRPVSVPPDGWIPLAQDDAAGSGRLSIFLPPPHELSDAMRSQDDLDVLQNSAPPSPAPSRSPSRSPSPSPMPPPGFMHGHAHHPRPTQMQMQAPVPVALVPQGIVPAFSNHSRASTRLSEYELLAPVSEPSSLSHRQMPLVEYDASAPGPAVRPSSRASSSRDHSREPPPGRPSSRATGSREAPPGRPPSTLRRREDYRPRRGPTRPKEIVFPAPLGPVVDQLATAPSRPTSRAGQPAYPPAPPSRQGPPGPDTAPERPPRARAPSSGAIPIIVQPPSPGASPPSPGNQTVTSHPDLLSPEHALNPLPLPILSLSDLPRNPTPATGPSPDPNPHPPRRPRSASRRPTYEAAPVPPGFAYPTSPLAATATATASQAPMTGAAKVRTRREQEEAESEAPLSPLNVNLSAEGLFNMVFPTRHLPWRRNTTRK